MSLPQNVYNHMRYGNGAEPGASATLPDGSEITVHLRAIWERRSFSYDHVRDEIVATHYTRDGAGKLHSQHIALRECPKDAPWVTYWTNEC